MMIRKLLPFLAVALVGCGGGFSAAELPDSGGDAAPLPGDEQAEGDVGPSPGHDGGQVGRPLGDSGTQDQQAATDDGGGEAAVGSDGGAACTPGTTRCVDANVETCSAGVWAVSAACPYVCSETGGIAACTGECVPGSVACTGLQPVTPVTCGNDGTCQPCTCGGSTSCFYAVSTPTSTYGAAYPVTVVRLTPASPTGTFVATISSPPQPDHNAVWFDLDVSAFPAGGSITITGTIGGSGCAASSYLAEQCATFPPPGGVSLAENASNSAPGAVWAFPQYQFAAGTKVLHFGTEGNWSSRAVPTNTNTVSVSVK